MDISKKLYIEALQAKAFEQFGPDVLNILNGQAMYEKFHRHQLLGKGTVVPFNEAMSSNATCEDIFSPEFNNLRASGHQVSLEEYEDKTIVPLRPLLENQFNAVVLWFGDDMFCQMNLLTLLAYLYETSYSGKVLLRIVNEISYEIEETDLFSGNYKQIYSQALIHHQLPKSELMPVMIQGIRLYLEYIKEDNEITAYIKDHLNKPQNELLQQLFVRFPQYGLGDLQYLEIIETMKGQDNPPIA